MIRSARKRHKAIWIVLVVLLPLLFAAGIFYRHSEPANEAIPAVERAVPSPTVNTRLETDDE